MHKKVPFLFITIAILATTSCQSSVDNRRFSFERVNYELNPGVSEDDLQGSPWINSNIIGIVDKVQKPDLKDDFYASVNYDDFLEGNPGPFDISSENTNNVLYSILDGTSAYPNKDLFLRTKSIIADADITTFKLYLDNFDAGTYFSSKDAFYGVAGALRVYKDDNDIYQIEFNDGYSNMIFGYQTFALFGSYKEYAVYDEYGYNISKSIYQGFGYDEYTSATLARTGLDSLKSLLAVNDTIPPKFDTLEDLNIDGLKLSLLDAGLNLEDRINISRDFYPYIKNLYKVIDSNSNLVTQAYKNVISFEYRYLLDLDSYKPISKYLSDSQLFDEVDLSGFNRDRASNYMSMQLLSILFEKAYIHLAGSSEVQNIITDLIEDILLAYKEMINKNSWLTSDTKKQIVKKLDYMGYTSCYSNKTENFPTVDETDINNKSLYDIYNSYYETILDASINGQIELNPVLMTGGMHSYTSNAFYSPETNEFVILNGLLSGGFVDEENIEVTYARAGTVIGHEISHAFDSTGCLFNEYGVYKRGGWWNSKDKEKFDTKVNKIKKFYKKIIVHDDVVQGSRVDGEATADMGGMEVILNLAKKQKDFDYDLFFRSYASLWKEDYSEAYLPYIDGDTHPYAYLRANVTLGQFDKFYKTYNIKYGDGMYIPPKDRIKIW